MSDFQPQDTPGTIKRLSFERLGGDDHSRYVRVQKGIIREITTPKLTVPLSKEGTNVYKYTDQNEITAALSIRDAIIRLIVFLYPVVKLHKTAIQKLDSSTVLNELFETKYQEDAPVVSPETYTNG